jgi:hypothetical protein
MDDTYTFVKLFYKILTNQVELKIIRYCSFIQSNYFSILKMSCARTSRNSSDRINSLIRFSKVLLLDSDLLNVSISFSICSRSRSLLHTNLNDNVFLPVFRFLNTDEYIRSKSVAVDHLRQLISRIDGFFSLPLSIG